MNTKMQRRSLVRFAAACALGSVLAMPMLAAAQANEPEAPVVSAPKILDALIQKDIVLDRPGQTGRPRGAVIDLQVQFAFDSAELLGQGKRQLDQLAMALNNKALMASGFQLAGHTDRVGDAEYNLRLSLARADAVKTYLAEAHGISPARLQTIGYGFARLVDPAHPAAAINRRVEVRRVGMLAAPPAAVVPAPGGRLVPTPN